MELSRLIPDRFLHINDPKWKVKGDYVVFKKIEHIPLCFIKDEIVYVFLENRLPKQVILLTQHLMKLGLEFYFLTTESSNPKGVDDFYRKNIKHYLTSYSKEHFFYGFNKISFNLIHNLVKWSEKEECFDLIKDVHAEVLKEVNYERWDYYSNKKYFETKQDIREEFRTMYREIVISKIL